MDSTTTALVPAVLPRADISTPTVPFLIDSITKGRNANTARAYMAALNSFAGFLKAPNTEIAMRMVLEYPRGTANALCSAWQADMIERGMAPGTINVRVGALRSIVADAHRFGMIDWKLSVKPVRSEQYRDTRGPGFVNYQKMLETATGDSPKSRRDVAIMRLLFDLGLRRFEVCGLDYADVNFADSRIQITGKGHREPQWLTVPPKAMAAIKRWCEHRGTWDGPLFTNLDRAAQNHAAGRRLSGEGVRRLVVKRYGDKIGIRCRPHQLRHGGATRAAEVTGGDMVAVCAFTRHADMNTAKIYVDNLRDRQGAVARLVGD